jgi:hypothetical protein
MRREIRFHFVELVIGGGRVAGEMKAEESEGPHKARMDGHIVNKIFVRRNVWLVWGDPVCEIMAMKGMPPNISERFGAHVSSNFFNRKRQGLSKGKGQRS